MTDNNGPTAAAPEAANLPQHAPAPAAPMNYAPMHVGQPVGYPAPAYYPAAMVGKSKTTAVLLAVFLSFWTWCYTYKTNAAKFWTGLGLCIISVPLDLIVIGWFISLGVWIWAIIDVATKDDSYYRSIA